MLEKGGDMKCPYLTRTVTVIAHQEPFVKEYELEDDDGNTITNLVTIDGPTVELTTEQHSDCIEEDCAAWYDGRCGYRK